MKKYLPLFLVCFTFIVSAQQATFKKGVVIDSVLIQTEADTESYALYLPKKFDLKGRWPVIFVFDYLNPGRKGVQAFVQAAEKFGYIIVGSNNITEGKIAANITVYNRLLTEVSSLFPIDKSKIYTAGFSGGARFATSIAVLSKEVSGVIASGAGFSSVYPPKTNTFSFAGLVGDKDFNYLELKNTVSFLKRKKFDASFYEFSGEHEWAPQELLTHAIAHIELKRNIKNGKTLADEVISEQYEEDKAIVRELINSKDPIKSLQAIKRMTDSYRVITDIDSLKEWEKIIKRNSVYRKTLADQRRALELESTIRQNYLDFFTDDLGKIIMDNLGWWEVQIESLDTYVNGADKAKSKMGIRLKNMLFVLGKETLKNVDLEKDKEKGLFLNIFMTLANKKAYDAYLQIMQLGVKDGNYEMALYYTEELLKNGFKDRDRLYDTSGLSTLRITPEFRALVEKYL